MIHNDITCALTAGPGSVGGGAGAALSYNQVKFNFCYMSAPHLNCYSQVQPGGRKCKAAGAGDGQEQKSKDD